MHQHNGRPTHVAPSFSRLAPATRKHVRNILADLLSTSHRSGRLDSGRRSRSGRTRPVPWHALRRVPIGSSGAGGAPLIRRSGTLALFSPTRPHSAGCCLPTADAGDLDEQHGPRRAILAILTVLRSQQVDCVLARAAVLDYPATPRDPYPPQQ